MAQASGFSFSRFKEELRGVARGNQFRIDLSLPQQIRQFVPDALAAEESISFKAKSASIPALDLNTITIPFRGRSCKIAGDRELQPWTASIYLTDGFPERKFFETWQDSILGVRDASRNPNADLDYTADAQIHQLDQNGNERATYTFEGIWPQSIGEVSLDWENGELLTFDCTFEINGLSTTGIR